jgi:hypothetical protein
LANQGKSRIVKRGDARRSQNSAADELSLAIKTEPDPHGALLAALQRRSWILLLALNLPTKLQIPRLNSGNLLRRALWLRRSGESRTAAAQARQQQQANADCSGTPQRRHCPPARFDSRQLFDRLLLQTLQ